MVYRTNKRKKTNIRKRLYKIIPAQGTIRLCDIVNQYNRLYPRYRKMTSRSVGKALIKYVTKGIIKKKMETINGNTTVLYYKNDG